MVQKNNARVKIEIQFLKKDIGTPYNDTLEKIYNELLEKVKKVEGYDKIEIIETSIYHTIK